eukprot:6552840-Alexandrium_andersonii.AAC.2
MLCTRVSACLRRALKARKACKDSACYVYVHLGRGVRSRVGNNLLPSGGAEFPALAAASWLGERLAPGLFCRAKEWGRVWPCWAWFACVIPSNLGRVSVTCAREALGLALAP